MKKIQVKISVLILLSFVFAGNMKAQKAEFGVRFMPTVSNFDLQTSSGGVVESEAVVGYGGGVFLGFSFTEHVGIQAEVIYNSASQKYVDNDVESVVNLKYVNIPLLLTLNTGKTKAVNLSLVAGPQLGLNVGSDINSTGGNGTSTTEAVLSVKKSDIGFAYGAGLDFGLNTTKTIRLGIGFRGVFGLVDISDNSENQTTDSYYVLDRTEMKTYSGYAGVSFLF